MFGSKVLDIAVGLVLVFLLMSLILTAAREAIEGILQSRAVNLEESLFELLQGDESLLDEFYRHPLVASLYRGSRTGRIARVQKGWREKLKPTFWQPHLLRRRSLPSYIPRETFAAAILDLVHDPKVKTKAIDPIYAGFGRLVGDEPKKLRRELEGWYDAAMDRASGVFKRRTQEWLFLVGLSASVLLNVNSIAIAQYFAVNDQAREYANQLAVQVARPDAPEPELARFREEVDRIGLPIGWSHSSLKRLREDFPLAVWEAGNFSMTQTIRALPVFVTTAAGYLITAFAVMLGAPFWFDVLNKIMVIRSTVKPKEKSPDEPSQDGGRDKIRDEEKVEEAAEAAADVAAQAGAR